MMVDTLRAGMWVQVAGSCPLTAQTSAYYDGSRLLTSNVTLTPAGGERSLWIAALLVPFSKSAPGSTPHVTCAPMPGGVQFGVQGAWGLDTLFCRSADNASAPGQIEVVRRFRQTSTTTFTIAG
jgi:hypothetical protein